MARPQRRRRQSYQTLFEVLGQLLAPQKTRAIIEQALAKRGLSELPPARHGFVEFVHEGVAPLLTDLLGSADAELVVEELLRIAQLMPSTAPGAGPPQSGQRPAGSHSEETLSEAAGGASRITVPAPADFVIAVATSSADRLERIEARVAGSARVRRVTDAISLFDVLQSETVALLLVDLHAPVLQFPTLLALSEDIPETSHVVVWSSDESIASRCEENGWDRVADETRLFDRVERLLSE